MRLHVSLVCAALAACHTQPAPAAESMAVHDNHSCAQPDQVRVTHLDLDLTLDFQAKAAFGQAGLTIERHDQAAPLRLDTKGLDIGSVVDDAGAPLDFHFGDPDPILGRPLAVSLPRGCNRVLIRYRTQPTAAAMQWLAPAQTADGKKPFLFTQGEAILTRTWIPLQDTPSVRQTWTATIRAPAGLVPVMSAMERTPAGGGAVHFAMPQAVPSYLIALACGDLERREISSRCAVWSEPGVVERAGREFADMEAMVTACESLFGPYRWGRYDLLILPPSFPFGGMENPCLTFATPTVIAGDKSLVSLVAHELAHSWSGNLVTNATWRDFWLNEGFTVYLEQRIMERVYGRRRAEMEIVLGMQELAAEMQGMPGKDQILHIDLAGRDPDDGMSNVPYQKGAALLRRLEQLFGRERFDAFLRRYFAAYSFQSIVTATFEAFLQKELLATDTAAAAKIDVPQWIHQPGLPADAPVPFSDAFSKVDACKAALLQNRDVAALAAASAEWSTQEWLRLLAGLGNDRAVLSALDDTFHFTASGNSEILTAWLLLAIAADYQPAMPRLEQFLQTVGRRKFLKPLYEALLKAKNGHARALAIYQQARPRYHAVTTRTLDDLLGYRP
jgi:aminopeptidase N